MPAGPSAEDHVVARQRFHIRRLHRRARDDRLLARADHHLGRRGHFVVDDAVEAGLRGHAEHRLDRFGIDVMAAVEPVVEADQHVAGAGRGVGLAFDLHAVAARRDVHAKPVLDRDQVAVIVAEQRPEQIRLLELELQSGAVGDGGQFAARPSGGRLLARTAPAMLFGPALSRVTSTMSPRVASVSTWTD